MNRNVWGMMCGLLVALGTGCGKTEGTPTSSNQPALQEIREVPPPSAAADRTKNGYVHLRGSLFPGTESRVELLRLNDQISGTVRQGGASTQLVYGSADGVNLLFSASRGERVLFSVSGTWTGDGRAFTGMVSQLESEPTPFRLDVAEPDTGDGQAVLALVSADRKETLNPSKGPSPSCESSAAYPQVVRADGVSAEAIASINRRLREVAVSSTSAQAAVDQFVEDCLADQNDLLDEDMAFASTDWSHDVTFSVALNRKHLLSVVFDTYDYSGGAHPNSYEEAVSFDLLTGRELGVVDLVEPARLREFTKREHALVLASHSEALYDSTRVAFQAFVANKESTSTEAIVDAFRDWRTFYLNESMFTSFYSPYEIAPYVAGRIEVDLPYETWEDLMKADSPLRRLVR